MSLPPVHHVKWTPCWRLIPSRYPEERVFDRVADPGDRPIVEALEGMTSDRQRQERGEVDLVAPGDQAKGPGSAYIMAAFSYLSPEGSRFTNGTYGVYYATKDLETSIAETKFHRERFMRYTKEAPIRLQMRALTANLDAQLHDLRGAAAKTFSKVLSKTRYAASQELGMRLRRASSYGIAWPSVRHRGGECVAVFRPPALSHCRQDRHMIFDWNGKTITHVYALQEFALKEKH